MSTNKNKWILPVAFLIFLCSCKKLIDIDAPYNQIPSNRVFSTDNAAVSALAGIYVKLAATPTYDFILTTLPALSADELNHYTSVIAFTNFVSNAISSSDTYVRNIWLNSYNLIYQANAFIENANLSNSITDTLKRQLVGEAMFIRAFSYFELINFFGDVPLSTTTNVSVNSISRRSPSIDIYKQIVADLKGAQLLLKDFYAGPDRARVNQAACSALLARIYLYTGDWAGAEEQASNVISKSSLYVLGTDLNAVFLKGSRETIFQLATVNGFTSLGSNLIPNASTPNYAFTNNFLNAIAVADLRKASWMKPIISGTTTYYYPYKYKQRATTSANPEFNIVLRLAEQYLIRAEARYHQNRLIGANSAASDINVIRKRAGLSDTPATTPDEINLAIEQERRIELFTEWGHRWFDLKRTGRINEVLGTLKPGWTTTAALYPIPISELNLNPNLVPNKGY